jgi:hypothetical protein
LVRAFQRVPIWVRWWTLGLTGVVAFVLGVVGFNEYLPDPHSAGDVVYRTIKLFFLSGPEEGNLPISLEIARFLAPLVSSYAAISALAILFRDRLQQMRIPLMRGHVVVCGLGYVGSAFVEHLKAENVKVVVIELDESNPLVKSWRRGHVPVVVGDALDERTLMSAKILKASHLLAVCADDAVNTEIIATARQVSVRRRSGRLRCLARVGDPDLCSLLRVQESGVEERSSSLDFFNLEEVSARHFLDRYGPFDASEEPHIVVSDLGPVGEWLVRHAARSWYERSNEARLRVTVLDDAAEERVASLVDRHPSIAKVCTFATSGLSTRDLTELRARIVGGQLPPVTRAYVSDFRRDEQALETALSLRHHFGATMPIALSLARSHGVARLFAADAEHGIDVFPVLDETCTVELVEGGSFEGVAQAIHEYYLAMLGLGPEGDESPGGDAAQRPWSLLGKDFKDANREQARHIPVKARAVGCAIAPLHDWDAAEFAFTAGEVEQLASLEHDRWMDVKRAQGWELGPRRDNAKKITNLLVPFEDLPKQEADKDREFVRAVPALLASVGLQLVRVEPNGS